MRAATPADAAAVAAVHHASWVETYAGLLPASHWETDTLDGRTRRWCRALADGVPLTVAEVDGRIVGIALAGDAERLGSTRRCANGT